MNKIFTIFIESENFQRFIIQKLNNLEMKINRIENNMNAHHKVILQKLAISNVEMEEKEDIDVFEDLPLKDEANLMLMETKLKNDLWYRNQMVGLMFIFQYYKVSLIKKEQ